MTTKGAIELTIAIPAFNERESLPFVVDAALAALTRLTPGAGEVLIVDDGGTDGTGALADALAKRRKRVRVFSHPENRGFAAAQDSCYEHAAGRWTFLLPADGQVDAAEIDGFWKRREEADLIVGVYQEPGRRGARIYHALARALFRKELAGLGDFGACLLVRSELARATAVAAGTPVAMTELVVRAQRTGAKVAAQPVTRGKRRAGTAKGGLGIADVPGVLGDLLRLLFDRS